MADIKGTYSSKAGEYPRFTYTIGYTQTARSATSVTYSFNVSYTKTNYQYGYDIQVNWNVGGVTGSKQILAANDDWRTSGSTTFTVTIATNATGGTFPARIYTSSKTDSTHSLQKIDTGTSTTVTRSTFNTAPVLSGSLTAPTTQTIAENVKTITVTCPTATDAENNIEGYRFAVSVSGGAYSEISKGSAKSITHTLSGGEGTTYKYSCYAYDKYGATSATIYSGTVTKNTLTAAALASTTTSSITSSTTSLTFNWGAPSNKNGNTTFSFEITSTEIPIYRATASNSTRTLSVPIVTSAPTSGPYILKNDIINKFKGTSYKGTINFTLKTTNAYGTSKTSTRSATVNLQSTPATPGSCAIASDSTAYRTISSTKYLIPDSSKTIKITWGAVTGAVGESISYDLQVKYGDGEYTQLINTTSTSYTHSIGKQTISQSVSYRVRAKASYGTTGSFKTATTATLHYYNAPTLVMGAITRGADNAKVTITVKNNTSLTSVIKTKGSWKRYATGTTTPTQQSGTLSDVQTAQIIELTGLTDAGQYDLAITYNDNTGFTSDQSETVKIGANSPLFFVNKHGAGINGVKADANYALKIKGSMSMSASNGNGTARIKIYDGLDTNGCGMSIQSGGLTVIGGGEAGEGLYSQLITDGATPGTEKLYLASDQEVYFASGCNTIANRKIAYFNTSGNLHVPGAIYVGSDAATGGTTSSRVYATNYKPTAADVGAIPTSGTSSVSTNVKTTGYIMCKDLRLGKDVNESGALLQTETAQSGKILKINTGQGTMVIGPQNTSWCHFNTSVPQFYFYKPIMVEGNYQTAEASSGTYGYEMKRKDVGRTRMANASYHGSLAIEGWNPYGTHNYTYTFITGSFYCNNNQSLGASSGTGRWGQVYSTVGSISTSDSKVKENIKPIAKSSKTRAVNSSEGATSADMWNYIKNAGTYTFKYKSKYMADGAKQNTMMGILADEIPDTVFYNIGQLSKTEEEYQDELKRQVELTKVYEEEMKKVPTTLELMDKESREKYDINGNWGNEFVEGIGLTRRELKREVEKEIEGPVRMINSSCQIAMLQEVLGVALNRIETLEEQIKELRKET